MSMSFFHQWNSTKEYSRHLDRLQNVKSCITLQKHQKRYQNQSKSKAKNKNLSVSIQQKKRPKSDNFLNKNHNTSLILPSIYGNQQDLLRKSISERKIKNRDAQILIENYLLGKRILNVKPMATVKVELLQKDFQKHEDYINARTHSKEIILKSSQKRLQNFLHFEKVKKTINETLRSRVVSHGNYLFSIKINDLKRVCNISFNKHRIYNLIMKLGKKKFQYKHLTLAEIKRQFSFNFKKKDVKNFSLLLCQLQEIIQNDTKTLGEFMIDMVPVYQQIQTSKKNEDLTFQRKDEMEGIQTKISELLIGTIYFDYKINRVKD